MAKRAVRKSTMMMDIETTGLDGKGEILVGERQYRQRMSTVKWSPVSKFKAGERNTKKKPVQKPRALFGQTYVIVHEVGPSEETIFKLDYESALKSLPPCQEVTIVSACKLQLIFTYQNPVTNQTESKVTILSGAKYQICELIKLFARTPNVSIIA